jgi:hypothetical protein
VVEVVVPLVIIGVCVVASIGLFVVWRRQRRYAGSAESSKAMTGSASATAPLDA